MVGAFLIRQLWFIDRFSCLDRYHCYGFNSPAPAQQMLDIHLNRPETSAGYISDSFDSGQTDADGFLLHSSLSSARVPG